MAVLGQCFYHETVVRLDYTKMCTTVKVCFGFCLNAWMRMFTAIDFFSLPDDTKVDIKKLLSVCVCHVGSVGEDSHSGVMCCHTVIYCRNVLSVSKAIYSNHSMSLVRGWIMVCEASETGKLRNLTVPFLQGRNHRQLAVHVEFWASNKYFSTFRWFWSITLWWMSFM